MMKIVNNLLVILCVCFCATYLDAVQEPRSMGAEPKLKIITYNPNAVHKYVGYYNVASLIQLESGEEVQNIFMGNPTGWQLMPNGNQIMLKPISDDCKTNGLIMTNRRLYWMEFDAMDPAEADLDDVVYQLQFLYSDTVIGGNVRNTRIFAESSIPSFKNAKDLNFNYRISGSEKISPLLAFNDGRFTYLKFKVVNSDLPAIFRVNNRAEEGLINYKVIDDYIVIEAIDAVYTMRYGEEVACLYNESLPFSKADIIRRKTGLFGKN